MTLFVRDLGWVRCNPSIVKSCNQQLQSDNKNVLRLTSYDLLLEWGKYWEWVRPI